MRFVQIWIDPNDFNLLGLELNMVLSKWLVQYVVGVYWAMPTWILLRRPSLEICVYNPKIHRRSISRLSWKWWLASRWGTVTLHVPWNLSVYPSSQRNEKKWLLQWIIACSTKGESPISRTSHWQNKYGDGSINHAGSSNLFLHLSLSRSFHSLYPFLWVQTLMNSDFAGSTPILGVQISMFCATEDPFFLAPQEIRRLFPFEVDPLEDMPFLAVASASRSRGFQAIRGFQPFWLPQSYPRSEIWFDSEKEPIWWILSHST